MSVELLEDRRGAEALAKSLHDLNEDVRQANAKPGGQDREDAVRIEARLAEIHKLAKEVTTRPTISIRTPLEPEGGMDRRLYNLLMLTPDEMEGLDRNALGGLRRGAIRELQQELQLTCDRLVVVDLMLGGNGSNLRRLKLWAHWERLVEGAQRALGTGTAGSGGNWVPTGMSIRLQEYVRPELVVASLFQQLDMPSKVHEPPVLGADPTGYFVAEGAQVPASDPVTNKATLTAVKLAARILANTEFDEDTAVAEADDFARRLGTAIGRAIEDAVVNGDTNVGTASAQDDDMKSNSVAISTTANGTTTLTTAASFVTSKVQPGDVITGGSPAPPAGTVVVSVTNATTLVMNNAITAGTEPQSRTFARPALLPNHARKAWDGLRKRALIANMSNQDLGTFSDTNVIAIAKGMGIYGAVWNQGAWVIGLKAFNKALQTPLATFLTMDRVGPLTTVLPGMVATYAGRPVVLSEFVREDVTAAGAVQSSDPALNVFTFLLYVNRAAYVLGRRRAVTIDRSMQHLFDTDQAEFRGTWRGMFQELFVTAAAANKSVGIGRNFS